MRLIFDLCRDRFWLSHILRFIVLFGVIFMSPTVVIWSAQLEGDRSEVSRQEAMEKIKEVRRREYEEYVAEERRRLEEIRKNYPGDYEAIMHMRANASRTPPALLIKEGKLLILQTDGTFTQLDVETGSVLRRIAVRTSERPIILPLSAQNMMTTDGSIVGFDSFFSVRFVLDESSYEPLYFLNVGPTLLLDDYIVFSTYNSLVFFNKRSREKKSLDDIPRSNSLMDIGGRVLCFQPDNPRRKTTGSLDCFDPAVPKRLWSVRNDSGKEWLGAVTDGERIIVFAGRQRDFPGPPCEAILVFSLSGKLIEEREAKREMFSGTKGWDFSDVTYLGNRYRNGMPDSWYNRDGGWVGWPANTGMEYFKLQIKHLDFPIKTTQGMVSYSDSKNYWNGVSYCVDELIACEKIAGPQYDFYSVAMDDDHIIYATTSGKVECLRRKDGMSKWIYSFPLYNLVGWDIYCDLRLSLRDAWQQEFFTDKIRYYQNDLLKLKGVAVKGDGKGVDVPVISDPMPVFDRVDHGGLIRLAAWGFPAATIAAMAILRKRRRRALLEKGHESIYFLRWDIYVIITLSTAAAVGFNYLVFSQYGRYSRFTALFLLFTCILAFAFAVHMTYVAVKARRERARGLFSERELEELKYIDS